MKIHLPWIRVTAAAVLVAGVGVHEAAAQYAPYRPIPQQPAAPAQAAQVPVVAAPPTQQPYYTAYRTQPAAQTQAYVAPQSPAAYGSPTGAQYTQPTAAYPQYPQTAGQYPQTQAQPYPTNYGAYSYVAQQPGANAMPAPNNTSAAQPSNGAMTAAPANGTPANGACGCNAATYGAGDYYTTPGCGNGATGGYPNCGVGNYMADTGCNENQWFGGVYVLGMTRTNATPVKLTSEIPTGSAYPYWPTANDTVMTTRDVNYDFRAGLEFRVGSTFTIGEPTSACQSSCGYNTGCGSCNSCAPVTTYAWELAWWGLDNSPNTETVVYDTDRLVGMKNYAGLQYNGNAVNNYYGYQLPVPAGPADPQILAQRVRTDFKAQNLELNFIRFPVCDTGCSTGSCGGNSCGCDDSCGGGFSMYGSCGVRYFHVDDDFMYGTEFNPGGAHPTYDGFGYDNNYELFHDIQVENSLVGPQVGWTTDYCIGKWNLFCNSTFGVFNNHMSVWQRMFDGTGTYASFYGDGSTYNVKTNKDAVAFLGELRVGTAYDISCHWRAIVAYRAVAITGVATASDQLQNDYSDRYSAGIIDSDNAVIIHGAQVGAECRY